MERKTVKMEIKEVDDAGFFVGHASTFDIDLGNDRIEPGAFKRTIRSNKGVVSVLDGHDIRKEVGLTKTLAEDAKGLPFTAGLFVDDSNPKNEIQLAREALIRMRRRAEAGKPMGVSIGFNIPKGKSFVKEGIRVIKEVQLLEISLTPFPMNPKATVTGVKSLADAIREGDISDPEIMAQLKELTAALSETKDEPSFEPVRDLITELRSLVPGQSADPENHSSAPDPLQELKSEIEAYKFKTSVKPLIDEIRSQLK